jgi:phosphate starvation-inducible protein PhoH and related proteins
VSKKKRKQNQSSHDQAALNESAGNPNKDHSKYIPQRDKISRKLNIRTRDLTGKQNEFLKCALDKETKLMLISGPSGSSKTFLAVLSGLILMNDHRVSDLLYIRSVVESADAKMGFLPGEQDEKLAPYLVPLMEKLDEFLSAEDINFLQKDDRITGIPVGYLRGLNWNAKVIVADEAQNMSHKELVTLMTRVGEFSKLYITGDPMQADIGNKSGFKHMYDLFNDEESKKKGIHCFEFTEEDIVRSELVRFIIQKLKTIEHKDIQIHK